MAFHFISFSCSCPLEPYCKPFPRCTVSSTPLFFSLCKIFRTKDANSLYASTIIVFENIYIIHANKGRDLSTPPSAFHSDAFISAPLRSALLLPVFKPSTLQTFPSVLLASLHHYLLTSLPQDQLILPPRRRRGQCPLLQKTRVGGRAGAIFHVSALFDPTSHLPYTLPSSVSRNPFVCQSCENCRVYTNNSHSETHHSLLAIPPAGSILWVGI